MMTDSDKQNLLKSIVWDYRVDGKELMKVLSGSKRKEGPFDLEKLFIRILERLPWYDILDLLGKDRITQLLTNEMIGRLRLPEQRERYERIRKILQGEPVSFSGWNPENREKYRRSLLSNRWYRT